MDFSRNVVQTFLRELMYSCTQVCMSCTVMERLYLGEANTEFVHGKVVRLIRQGVSSYGELPILRLLR